MQNLFSCSLEQMYKKHAKRLQQTGGGLDNEGAVSGAADTELMMTFYILPKGPDNDTGLEAQNLWGMFVLKLL